MSKATDPRPARPTSDAIPEPMWIEDSTGICRPSGTHARPFLGLIRAGQELDRGLDEDLRRAHGMGLRAYEVLLYLAAFAPDRTWRISRLTALTPLSQSRVSRLIDELEADGLVARTSLEGDRRGVAVTITDDGIDRLRELQDTHHRSLHDRFYSRLSDEQLVQLAAITSAVLARDPLPRRDESAPAGEGTDNA